MSNGFDLDYLKSLVAFMKENELDEIKVSEGDNTIRLRRNLEYKGPAAQPMPMYQNMVLPPEATPAAAPVAQPAAPAEEKVSGHVLKSPMVGTFYLSSSPEAASFVNIGDTVKKGQTLCIIEAMKTMNQIESDKDGVIKQVLSENAEPVEFGTPLFIIE